MSATPSPGSNGDTGDTGRDADDDERHVCAVCGRVLNAYVSPHGERSWLHSFGDLPEDHPAVVVAAGDGIIPQPRCDFCNGEDPAWELPARSFVIPGLALGAVDNGSHGNWSACDTCADLIRRDQWTALRRRAVNAWWDTSGHPDSRADVDRQLARIYRLLRANVAGSLRWNPPPP